MLREERIRVHCVNFFATNGVCVSAHCNALHVVDMTCTVSRIMIPVTTKTWS